MLLEQNRNEKYQCNLIHMNMQLSIQAHEHDGDNNTQEVQAWRYMDLCC